MEPRAFPGPERSRGGRLSQLAPPQSPAVETAPHAQPPGPPRGRGFSLRTFESLRHPAFRWFLGSTLGSMAALNMQILVRGYLAFELTDSFSALGLIGLASAVPMLALSPVGGVLADRIAKKRLLQVGQTLSAAMAIAIGLLIASGQLRFEHLFAASLLQGMVFALIMPASQAIVPEVIGRPGIMNAVSLNAASMNFVRLIAPAAGGLLIALLGASWVYFLMAGLYGIAVALLGRVPAAPAAVAAAGDGAAALPRGMLGDALHGIREGLRDLADGVRYSIGDRDIFQLLAMNFVTSMLGLPFMVMLPGYVREVYDGGAGTLGLLVGISGAGALAGALIVASLPERRRGLLMMLSALLIGGSLVAFASTEQFWLGAVFMAVAGVGTAGRQALSAVLLHTYVDNAYRGRVMAVFMTQISLMLGAAFFVGLLAEAIGVRQALASLGAALMVAIVAFFVFMPRLRQMM